MLRRLIGHALEARVHPNVVEIWLGNSLLETMPRLRGGEQHRIDYRHVIWSLENCACMPLRRQHKEMHH